VVDNEGVNRKLGGCEVETEGFDAPVGKGVGVVEGNNAFGHLRVEISDPVDDEVVAAGVALAGVASGGLGRVGRKVCHCRSVETHARLLPQDAAAGEPDAFRKGLVTFGLGQVGATVAGLKRKARDFTAGNWGDRDWFQN
jgi:hypothetical protein